MEPMTITDAGVSSGQRGPADHKRRQQILQAADAHFRLYGYHKTALADIAKAIDLSTPYLYKFFNSKQAIGEAVCSQCLAAALSQVEELVAGAQSPVDKLRRVFIGLEESGWNFLNEEKKIHDLVSVSFAEGWGSLERFKEARFQMVRRIVVQGRESGEFERKTPLEETCRTIAQITDLFFHPMLLEQAGKSQKDEAIAAANLVVRSLTA